MINVSSVETLLHPMHPIANHSIADSVILLDISKRTSFRVFVTVKQSNTMKGGNQMRKYLRLIFKAVAATLVHLFEISLEGIIIAILIIWLGIN